MHLLRVSALLFVLSACGGPMATKTAQGGSCSAADDCASGSCTDGVCCDTACDGVCMACDSSRTGVASGACSPVKANSDPDDECRGDVASCKADTCNGSGACGASPSGTVCRASASSCDAAEVCDGTTFACPANAAKAKGTECRAAADACDVAETCDGTSPSCPTDALLTAGTTCRAATNGCDVAEVCDGASVACPGDGFAPPTQLCRASAGTCDVAEYCTDGVCPADGLIAASAQVTCRAAGGPCDLGEVCDGVSALCPADAKRPATDTCRAAGGPCDKAELCDGTTDLCPIDAKRGAGLSCRAPAGTCDAEEVCNGVADTCPADQFLSATTACGAYFCSGASASCRTSCTTSVGQCTSGNACGTGTCQPAKLVFVTSTAYAGNLGGVTGADAKCQARATAAGLTGTWRAWISVFNPNASPATSSTFTRFTGPYMLRNQTVIADSWSDLIDGSLDAPIDVTELNGSPADQIVWTGTNPNGTASTGFTGIQQNCTGWTSSGSTGSYGDIGDFGSLGYTTTAWTQNGNLACNQLHRLFCFQQ